MFGKYKIEDVTDEFDYESYEWIYILPSIEYRHKYWYLWEFSFSWFNIHKRIQITKIYW